MWSNPEVYGFMDHINPQATHDIYMTKKAQQNRVRILWDILWCRPIVPCEKAKYIPYYAYDFIVCCYFLVLCFVVVMIWFREVSQQNTAKSEKSPTTYLCHIPQCTIPNRNMQVSVLNDELWDMGKVHGGIRDIDLFIVIWTNLK